MAGFLIILTAAWKTTKKSLSICSLSYDDRGATELTFIVKVHPELNHGVGF